MATREELEHAIDEHPADAATYLVFADWLQEHLDPRAELITLHGKTDQVAKARRVALERELAPTIPPYSRLEWFYGFVRRSMWRFAGDAAELVRRAFEHPSLRHVVEVDLTLADGRHDDRQWLSDLIAERPRPCWRNLRIASTLRGGNEPLAGELDLSAIWSSLPRIEHLYVGARHIKLGDLRSETLFELELDGEVAVSDLAPVLADRAPKLGRLILHDVDPRAFALALERSELGLGERLYQLVLPHADDKTQRRIGATCEHVEFAPFEDGDRYEQIDDDDEQIDE